MANRYQDRFYPIATLVVVVTIVIAVLVLRWNSTSSPTDQLTQDEYYDLQKEYFDSLVDSVAHNPLVDQLTALRAIPTVTLGTEPQLSTLESILARDSDSIPVYYSKPTGAGPFPVVILVHGGESSSNAAKQTAQAIGERITTELGFVTISVDWRDSTIGKEDLIDIVSVVDWVSSVDEVDQEQVYLLGEDYGAYLSLFASTEVSVNGIIGVNAYTDAQAQYDHFVETNEQSAGVFLKKTGCDQAINSGSCLHALSITSQIPTEPTLLLIHGEENQFVPISQSEHLHSLRNELNNTTLQRIVGSDISGSVLADPQASGYETVWSAIGDWFAIQLNKDEIQDGLIESIKTELRVQEEASDTVEADESNEIIE